MLNQLVSTYFGHAKVHVRLACTFKLLINHSSMLPRQWNMLVWKALQLTYVFCSPWEADRRLA